MEGGVLDVEVELVGEEVRLGLEEEGLEAPGGQQGRHGGHHGAPHHRGQGRHRAHHQTLVQPLLEAQTSIRG